VRTVEAGPGVGPGGDQGRHDLRTPGEVTGPVGRDVQQRARALAVLALLSDARRGQTGMVGEQPPQPGQIPGPYRLRDGDGLVELPGSDVTRTTTDLAGHLDTADGHDLERLIDRLVRHTTPGQHTDDIAVILLRASRLRGAPA
jgi:hypothetical protein